MIIMTDYDYSRPIMIIPDHLFTYFGVNLHVSDNELLYSNQVMSDYDCSCRIMTVIIRP